MSQPADPQYAERFEAFIRMANSQLASANAGRVGLAMTDASARFYAWLWAINAPSAQTLQAKRDAAIEEYTRLARQLFSDHFDTYIAGYDTFIKPGDKGQK